MRMSLALEMTISFYEGAHYVSTTADIGTHGFSTVLPLAATIGSRAAFLVRLPGSLAPIAGTCVVTSTSPAGGLYLAGVKFDRLDPAARVRLELTLFQQSEDVEQGLSRLPKPSLVYTAAADFEPQGGLNPPPGRSWNPRGFG